MKKITISMIISLISCLIISILSSAAEVEQMTSKLIRVHIIANSDSDYDQSAKLAVRDCIVAACDEFLSDCTDKSEALAVLFDNLEYIEALSASALNDFGADSTVTCTLSKALFPDREYQGFTLPAGVYDALCIRIGQAEGQNFWCICYPSLCISACSSIEDCDTFTDDEITIIKYPEKVTYKLFCFKLVEKIRSLFV